MPRLNLTLDDDTYSLLVRHAEDANKPQASVARALLREALELKQVERLQQQLAADYVADRADSAKLLAEVEASQLDLDDDEQEHG